jgi:hypothetical protein
MKVNLFPKVVFLFFLGIMTLIGAKLFMDTFQSQLMPKKIIYTDDMDDFTLNTTVVKTDSTSESVKADTCAYVNKNLQWRKNSWKGYKIEYKLCKKDIVASKAIREQYIRPWGKLYNTMSTNDRKQLKAVASGYQKIAKKESLNDLELAELVVQSIQYIPYTLIHSGTHEEDKESDEWSQNYHKELKKKFGVGLNYIGGCIENVEQLGVMSPLEFAYYHTGDCDTRTTFLYTILKELGFDVAILNSIEHSMLGLNLYPGPLNTVHVYDKIDYA